VVGIHVFIYTILNLFSSSVRSQVTMLLTDGVRLLPMTISTRIPSSDPYTNLGLFASLMTLMS
jgi:hypothetical protein